MAKLGRSSRLILLAAIIGAGVFFLGGCSLFNRGPKIQNWQPAVSPSGDQIAFADKDGDDFELFKIPLDGGERTQLTNNEDSDWSPVWSGDGKSIAFVSSRDKNTDIYKIDADGQNEIRLTSDSGQDVNPRWIGNDRVIFNSDRSGQWQIYVVEAAGGEVKRIAVGGQGETAG